MFNLNQQSVNAKNIMAVLLYLVIFLIVLSPVLFGFKVFGFSDTITLHYPTFNFYQQSIKQDDATLINPYLLGGFPTYVSIGGFWSPLTQWFLRIFSYLDAYHYLIFIYLIVASWLTFLFLRHLNISFWPAWLGGLTFVFSQWYFVTTLWIVAALPVLPAMFLVVAKIRRTVFLFGTSALLVSWSWYTVHFQWTIMMLLVIMVYSLFNWCWFKEDKSAKKFLAVILGVILGSLVALPQLIATWKMGNLSARSLGLNYYEAAVGALNIGDFMRLVLPYSNLPFIATQNLVYFGVMPTIFLVIGIHYSRRILPFYFFSLLFIFILFLSVKYSPLFWLLHQLPIFDSFREPWRWWFVGSFAATIVSSYGLNHFCNVRQLTFNKQYLKYFFRGLAVLIAFLLLFTISFQLKKDTLISQTISYFDNNIFAKTSGLPLEHYHDVIRNYFTQLNNSLSLINSQVTMSIIFWILAAILLAAVYNKKIKLRTFINLTVFITVINFVFVFSFYHPLIDKNEFIALSDTAKFLQGKTGRSFALMPGLSEFVNLTVPYGANAKESFKFQSELLSPNLNVLFGITGIDGYENLMDLRLASLLSAIGSDLAVAGEKLVDLDISLASKLKIFESRKKILDILGIKYIISVWPLDPGVFEPVFTTQATSHLIPITIYRNNDARPEVYLADNLVIMKEPVDEKNIYTILNDGSLGSHGVIIECRNNCPEVMEYSKEGELEIIKNSFDEMIINTNSPTKNFLVINHNHLPGWQIYIDNYFVKTYMVNLVQAGIVLPSGQHEIRMKYSSVLASSVDELR